MTDYAPSTIEKKWQQIWADQELFKASDTPGRKKFYVLDMFPYPSGEGLHVGHPKGYIATDVYARYHMMHGFDVLHPMGWDAFGLPAENYAIANKVHPRVAVEKNIARFKDQLQKIGFTYDWSREIQTTDPAYYKWTQWIFLKMYEAGLAYESHELINWCPSCQTGLAYEDLDGDRCERCGTKVERRPMRQWVLKITDYAEKLLAGLQDLEWPESIKESQRNWIGRSEGARLQFVLTDNSLPAVNVFTTRADTLFGATYLVIAPEHPLIKSVLAKISNRAEVEAYVETAIHKTDLQRQETEKNKTGVEIKGIQAINPATKENIPVWVADYVLPSYGTGAIMAVPAHDDRDFEFAQKFGVPIKPVIGGPEGELPYLGHGTLINSGTFNGQSSEAAKQTITEAVGGEISVMYKLRDWVFSRQRYWGEPIPIIHCEQCKVVPVPEKDLPVLLPEVEHYAPTGTGESPLAAITDWVNVACPTCGKPAKRETNTMPQWAGSSWYYLRYIDPNNGLALVDPKKERAWMPVDMYVGGAEHATRHLIYARFWHLFLYDQGLVSTPEPFKKLQHVGLVAGEDGLKMSKRTGNVINPDDIVAQYGADALRVYEMFMGPFNQGVAWSTNGLIGAHRFLKRTWTLLQSFDDTNGNSDPALNLKVQQTIARVTESTTQFRFNTAISALMELLNTMEDKRDKITREIAEVYVQLLSPYAPHIAEELWEGLGHPESILRSTWPEADTTVLNQATVTIPVQVNSRVRATLELQPGVPAADVEALAKQQDNVAKYLVGKEIQRVIFVPDTLINFVVS